MFFDERIEMKKLKLFKSSIIISMVMSLYFLVTSYSLAYNLTSGFLSILSFRITNSVSPNWLITSPSYLIAVNTMLFALFLLLIKNGKKTNTLSGNFW